ncbi:hypothetical protein [Deinococcus sonorensis]|uniref:Carboxypeptidase n=1 Tax=Deinococcus sonorensis KR-87 TaxID=694439 RepID=A0AAU7UCW0_9DEIO
MSMNELRQLLGQVSDLNAAEALMSWDQETQMPPAAAPVRGQQLATLAGLGHTMFTAPRLGELLDAAQPGSDADRRLVTVTTARL